MNLLQWDMNMYSVLAFKLFHAELNSQQGQVRGQVGHMMSAGGGGGY